MSILQLTDEPCHYFVSQFAREFYRTEIASAIEPRSKTEWVKYESLPNSLPTPIADTGNDPVRFGNESSYSNIESRDDPCASIEAPGEATDNEE